MNALLLLPFLEISFFIFICQYLLVIGHGGLLFLAMQSAPPKKPFRRKKKQQCASLLRQNALHGGLLGLSHFLFQKTSSSSHIFPGTDDGQVEKVLPRFNYMKPRGVINTPITNRLYPCSSGKRHHSGDRHNRETATFQNESHPCNIRSSRDVPTESYEGSNSSEADDEFEVIELRQSKNDHCQDYFSNRPNVEKFHLKKNMALSKLHIPAWMFLASCQRKTTKACKFWGRTFQKHVLASAREDRIHHQGQLWKKTEDKTRVQIEKRQLILAKRKMKTRSFREIETLCVFTMVTVFANAPRCLSIWNTTTV